MCQKTKQLLCYILQDSPRDVTSMIKLSYLIDLAAVRKFDRQISEFNYIRYNYGPFDQKVYSNLNDLQKEGKVVSFSYYNTYGESVLFKLNTQPEEDEFNLLSADEKSLIKEMLESLSGYGAKMLTEIAYSTAPMKALGAKLGGNEHLGELLDLKSV